MLQVRVTSRSVPSRRGVIVGFSDESVLVVWDDGRITVEDPEGLRAEDPLDVVARLLGRGRGDRDEPL